MAMPFEVCNGISILKLPSQFFFSNGIVIPKLSLQFFFFNWVVIPKLPSQILTMYYCNVKFHVRQCREALLFSYSLTCNGFPHLY